jgi:hypothetical protein
MFSSCYHAFLGVAIFIFIQRSQIIKTPLLLAESIYIKRKFKNLTFGHFKSVSFLLFPVGAYIFFSIQNGANSALLLLWIPRMHIKELIKKISTFFPFFLYKCILGIHFGVVLSFLHFG